MSEATQDLIGMILGGSAQRDAIHIAVAPAIAAVKLSPGQHVGIKDGKAIPNEGFVGVVDPFLTATVREGQRFFVFLYPNTITGLRHVWTHPVLDSKEAVDKAASEKWLREFADDIFYDYNESPDFDSYALLLKSAEDGDFCLNSQPDWLYEEGAQQKQEMWAHLEVVRGRQFTFGHKSGASFRCSC